MDKLTYKLEDFINLYILYLILVLSFKVTTCCVKHQIIALLQFNLRNLVDSNMSCISCRFYCIFFIDEVFHRFCLLSYRYESQIKFQPNNFLIIYVTITITYRLFLVTKQLVQII